MDRATSCVQLWEEGRLDTLGWLLLTFKQILVWIVAELEFRLGDGCGGLGTVIFHGLRDALDQISLFAVELTLTCQTVECERV